MTGWEEVATCLLAYMRFLVPAVVALLMVHLVIRPPREVFRKLLHMVAFLSTPVVIRSGVSCTAVVVLLVGFGAVVWPILRYAERYPWYADLFVQRRPHEIRRSLLLLFWGNAALVYLCWELFDRPDIAITAILMWGFGDASAALVGKRFGKHKVHAPLVDPNKTWEGSGAMFAVSLVVGFWQMGFTLPMILTALAGTYVELITHGGYDTITVPSAIAAVLLLLA